MKEDRECDHVTRDGAQTFRGHACTCSLCVINALFSRLKDVAARLIQEYKGAIEFSLCTVRVCNCKCRPHSGLRIKETKEVYEGEVTELTPCETENPMGGYGKTISHVIIGLKTGKGTKQLKVRPGTTVFFCFLFSFVCS